MSNLRVHIEYDHSLNPVEWEMKYAAGLVPNKIPYGFHHLVEQGFDIEVRSASRSWVLQQALGGVARRVSGGFELVDALRDRSRRSCDVAVCWNERTGVPASARSVLPGEPPVVMGSIWMTDERFRMPRISKMFAEWALKQASAVWANTDAQLAILGDMGVSPQRRHLLLNPGIDADFWRSTESKPEPGSVLSVGNDRHRDHEYLVQVMKTVKTNVPRSTLTLITSHSVDVPTELGNKLNNVTHPRLRELYSTSAVVAVALTPNIHVSGCTSILEAMACERPVVVTGYAGYERYVDHGVTGYIVPPGDKAAFASAVCNLLESPALALSMGQAARLAIEQRFSSRRFMADLGPILRSVA